MPEGLACESRRIAYVPVVSKVLPRISGTWPPVSLLNVIPLGPVTVLSLKTSPGEAQPVVGFTAVPVNVEIVLSVMVMPPVHGLVVVEV